jgi:polyphosphate kinase
LSWLAFNERVFEQAADPSTPLLERVKFATIVASNLDEFFMVRVASLKQAEADAAASPDPSGMTPTLQLTAIARRAHALVADLYRIVNGDLRSALASSGIRLVPLRELDDAAHAWLTAFFDQQVLPVLTPLAVDSAQPFPLLSSLSLNVAVLLGPAPGQEAERLAIVQVPAGLPRLVRLPQPRGRAFVLLEDLIRRHLAQLFPGQAIREAVAVRLTRDAEIEWDDEGGRTHLEQVEQEIRRRRRSDVVRLEVEEDASELLCGRLCQQLDLSVDDVYAVPGPVDMRVLGGLVDLPGFEDLRDPPLQPADALAAEQSDLFSVLESRDVLLHHPYDAYDPVITLLAQAADDPDVLAIKQTLYRTSARSPILSILRRAAERGKQVTVLVEVTARFDEERNIRWARELEEAGAHVIYGVRGYKVHAKICLIVRRTADGLRRYVHLGTGNYNERTARAYTDFGLMTTSEAIAEDAAAFFNALTGYSDPPRLKRLVMAPTSLRQRLLKLIDRERRRAEAGQPSEIVAKMNSLLDPQIIEALYAASQAGVRIRLNVRGSCALRPGLPGVSTHIEVVSIVDRFLEHSRVFYFLNGGDDVVYLSSADWMARNLDRRVELMFPVEDPAAKSRVVSALRAMFRDSVKARWLGSDGTYRPAEPIPGEPPFRVQVHLLDEAQRRTSLARDVAGVVFRPEVGA